MPENTIRLECRLPHPTAAVWAALITPDLLARWWAPGDIAPTVGHRFTMDMGAWGQQQCEVVAVELGALISFLFSKGMGNGWPGLLSRIDGVLSGVS
jgi:uncharacterized protein YndB with AHSA1/START domain